MIRATLCHGLYLQRAEVRHAGKGAGLAWRAVASGGTLTTLPLQGPIPGYAVVGVVQPRSDGEFEVGSVEDSQGVSVGDSSITFKLKSLRRDELLVGTEQDGTQQFETAAQFEAPLRHC